MDKKTVIPTLSLMPRVLLKLEWPAKPFQKPALGGQYQDNGVSPDPIPQIRALRQPSPPVEAESL